VNAARAVVSKMRPPFVGPLVARPRLATRVDECPIPKMADPPVQPKNRKHPAMDRVMDALA